MLGYLIDLIRGADRHRAYYYRLALAISSALVTAGLVTDGRMSAIMTVLGAVLGVGSSGLASLNSSTRAPVTLSPKALLEQPLPPTPPAAPKAPTKRAAAKKAAPAKKAAKKPSAK